MVSKADDIWILKPTKKDLEIGAYYASVSLPWTFNRMSLDDTAASQNRRALNISKGILCQELLSRALGNNGVKAITQRKSHRDDDLFDFKVEINGSESNLDVKSFNYYSNYQNDVREALNSKLLVKYSGYPGPDWATFFPMLVPKTQVKQEKEAYCFGFGSSIDFRKDISSDRDGYVIASFPYGPLKPFLTSSMLCLKREEASKGIYLRIRYDSSGTIIPSDDLRLSVRGEWNNEVRTVKTLLKPNSMALEVGPFSVVDSFIIEREDFDGFFGKIIIDISRNELSSPVLSSARRNLNVIPEGNISLTKSEFCNLILPRSYQIYFVGWLTKVEFLKACRKYPAWIWPNDRVNMYANQPWSQITERDLADLESAGFSKDVGGTPKRINAGWMKTTGYGGGACCYVYPNNARPSGIRETNLYVLPQDLNPMSELGK